LAHPASRTKLLIINIRSCRALMVLSLRVGA
jgi:hypothetical protein